MTDETIVNGTYAPTTNSTLSDLKKFQNFLNRNLKEKFTHYKIWDPFLINLVGYTLLQKLVSLIR